MLSHKLNNIKYINRLAVRRPSGGEKDQAKLAAYLPLVTQKCNFHCASVALSPTYAATEILPIPSNVQSETSRFSPQRSRDINSTVMLSQFSSPTIDITTDNTMAPGGQDPHVQSYDCGGAVSLNSAMQSNVPSPFGGMHKFSHLNMPGGQWSQEYKFTAQYQHNLHYTALRENARTNWVVYDQNATIPHKAHATNWIAQRTRAYSANKVAPEDKTVQQPTKKEQLKRAFKEYGATIVAFHVAISLASLGGFYLLVSGGINMMPVLDFLGISSSALSNKIAAGASTFVVAYAVHKVFAPVRISITLTATPFIVRYLRSKGFLKPKQLQT